jgi:hypothetical protein
MQVDSELARPSRQAVTRLLPPPDTRVLFSDPTIALFGVEVGRGNGLFAVFQQQYLPLFTSMD